MRPTVTFPAAAAAAAALNHCPFLPDVGQSIPRPIDCRSDILPSTSPHHSSSRSVLASVTYTVLCSANNSGHACYSPSGIYYVTASENAAGFAGMLTTRPVAITLTANFVVKTGILVIVAGTVRLDVWTANVLARVSGESRRLIQVTLVFHCFVPDSSAIRQIGHVRRIVIISATSQWRQIFSRWY